MMRFLYNLLAVTLIPLLWLLKGAILGVALLPATLLVRWAGQFGWWAAVLGAGPAYFVFGVDLALLVVLIKWGSLYRARAGEFPFFSFRVVMWALTAQLHDMACFFFLKQIRGTPYLNVYFRMLGARIGRGVIINTTAIGDWDLITIEDEVMVGDDAVILAHVGEKGLLKMAPVHIGKSCTIGRDTAIFPGVTLGEGAVVAAMTVVPKGRHLDAMTVWGGTELHMLRARGGRVPMVEDEK
ncbi:MAG: DapH/DapD/GlmU-related protein [Pseudomonadota bacterium]